MAAAFGLVAWAGAAAPAHAFIVGFGFPYPGFYAAPWPYYPPPAYYPYYYPPPANYPPGAGAPAATAPAAAPSATGAAAITYTSRPAFRNGAGQTCREYRAANGALGTACEDAAGQWRVAD